MLFESLPTEPDTAAWSAWCRQRGLAVFTPAVDGPDLRVEPGDLDPWSSTSSSCRGWPSPPMAGGSGRAAATTTGSCPACATTASPIGAAFAEQLVADLPTESHDVHLTHVATDA